MLAMQGFLSWYQNHVKPIKREEVPPPKKQTKWRSDVDEDNSTGEQNMVVVKKRRVKNRQNDEAGTTHSRGTSEVVRDVNDV